VADQSKRDDLESLGYMMIYFLRGNLPWQGLRASNKEEKYNLILERKREIGAADLCKDLPAEFTTYMEYVHSLGHGDEPNYKHLRAIFRSLFYRQKFEYDNVFDWTILEFRKLAQGYTEKGKVKEP
jgi:serine/threonine protein kinase